MWWHAPPTPSQGNQHKCTWTRGRRAYLKFKQNLGQIILSEAAMHFTWCEVHCRKMGMEHHLAQIWQCLSSVSIQGSKVCCKGHCRSQFRSTARHYRLRCPDSYTIETIGRHTWFWTAILSCPAISQWQQAIMDSIKPPFPLDQELHLRTTFLGYEAKGTEASIHVHPVA